MKNFLILGLLCVVAAVIFDLALFQGAFQSGPRAVAAVTSNLPCIINGSKSYDPSHTDSIISYRWKELSGPSCNIETPDSVITKVSKLKLGTYIFSLTVTSAKGLTATAQTQVIVKL